MHKFGIYLHHSVEEAPQIDEEMETDFWRRAINKEMQRVKVAWRVHKGYTPGQVRKGEDPNLIGLKEVGYHMVFDVKMDFTCKA